MLVSEISRDELGNVSLNETQKPQKPEKVLKDTGYIRVDPCHNKLACCLEEILSSETDMICQIKFCDGTDQRRISILHTHLPFFLSS